MRFLKIKPTTLQASEERFDLPSFGILRQRTGFDLSGRTNQILALRQAHHADRHLITQNLQLALNPEFGSHCLFDAQLLERHAIRQMAFLQAQTKVQLVFKQISEHLAAGEFAVAEDLSDSLCAESRNCFAQHDDVFFAAHHTFL
jgi:hypothetical protein